MSTHIVLSDFSDHSLNFDFADSPENVALSRVAVVDPNDLIYTISALECSPMWQLMAAEILAETTDPRFAMAILSARMYQAGKLEGHSRDPEIN